MILWKVCQGWMREKNLPLYRRRLYIVQDIEAEVLLMMETCTASVWIEIYEVKFC